MPTYDEKAGGLFKKIAGEFVARESNRISLITVTNVRVEESDRRAIILVTVLPEEQEQTALEFLKRKRSDLRETIKKTTRLKTIPVVDFELDLGEKNRQRIDELSRKV